MLWLDAGQLKIIQNTKHVSAFRDQAHNRFLSGKIALHRPDMLSLKDAPSSVSAMWTAVVKGQSFSTVVCSTCGLTTGVFLQALGSNNPIYLNLAGLQNYLNRAHNTLLNISKCCSHYHPRQKRLLSLLMVKRVHLAARVHPGRVHDITDQQTTVAPVDITTCHDLGDT